jgi:hypothetical protein
MTEFEDSQQRINKVAAGLSAKSAELIADGVIDAAEKQEITEPEMPHVYMVTGIFALTNSVGGFLQIALNRSLTLEEHKDVLNTLHEGCGPIIRKLIEKYVPAVAQPPKTT